MPRKKRERDIWLEQQKIREAIREANKRLESDVYG